MLGEVDGASSALRAIENPRSPRGGQETTSRRSIREATGAPVRNVSAKPSARSPSTSIHTETPSFRTKPASPRDSASRNTVGRNPTPCTTPVTRIPNRRASPDAGAPEGRSMERW